MCVCVCVFDRVQVSLCFSLCVWMFVSVYICVCVCVRERFACSGEGKALNIWTFKPQDRRASVPTAVRVSEDVCVCVCVLRLQRHVQVGRLEACSEVQMCRSFRCGTAQTHSRD